MEQSKIIDTLETYQALLSVRIKFFDKKFLTTASVEQHKKKF